MIFSTIFAFLYSIAALAAPTSIPLKTEIMKDMSIKVTAPLNHHFNLKAPKKAWITGGKKMEFEFKKISDTEVIFKPVNNGLTSSDKLMVSLYLCDDKNTFCIKQEEMVPMDGAPITQPSPKPNTEQKHVDRIYTDKNGFLVNDPEKALKLSKETGKPLLIDFFGIWCPPCNMLDESVFNTKEFKKSATQFVLLKLDADSAVSWNLKSRYKVGGYPTVVFATDELDEINRIVGYYPTAEFIAKMDDAATNKTLSITRLGTIYFERGEFEKARSYFEKNNDKKYKDENEVMLRKIELKLLENKVKENKEKTKDYIALIEDTLKTFASHTQASTRLFLLDLKLSLSNAYGEIENKVKKSELLDEYIKDAKKLTEQAKSSGGKIVGTDVLDVDLQAMISDALEELNKTDEAKASFKKTAELYRGMISKFSDKMARGLSLEYAYALWKSGNIAEAKRVYRKYQKAYPKEFTFYFAEAKMHYSLKDLKSADEKASMAFKHSYGDNRIRSAELLAKIKRDQGKRDEAKIIITTVLKESRSPDDPSIRTTRYLTALKKLDYELGSELDGELK